MGIMHSCDEQRGVVYIVWDGDVRWDEWQEHASALLMEPYWRQSSRFLVDLRSVTSTSLIGEEEVQKAQLYFNQNREMLLQKRGAVIASDEFRNAHNFAKLLSPSGMAMVVFNSLDTACIFLGLDHDETSRQLDGLRSQLRGK
jgi:hypothetical protein